jgi:hypothetical protein
VDACLNTVRRGYFEQHVQCAANLLLVSMYIWQLAFPGINKLKSDYIQLVPQACKFLF